MKRGGRNIRSSDSKPKSRRKMTEAGKEHRKWINMQLVIKLKVVFCSQ